MEFLIIPRVVHMLIKKLPKSKYIVAVEPELISQGTIVKVSKLLMIQKNYLFLIILLKNNEN